MSVTNTAPTLHLNVRPTAHLSAHLRISTGRGRGRGRGRVCCERQHARLTAGVHSLASRGTVMHDS